MSDWTDIADAIEAKLSAITDIGKIHKNYPITTNWQEFLKEHKFTTTIGPTRDCIRSWMILPQGGNETWVTQSQSYKNDRIALLCFFGYADGITNADTLAEFIDFMESVLTKIREDYNLGNKWDTQQEPEWEYDAMPITFGKVGCHAGRIILRGQIDKTF